MVLKMAACFLAGLLVALLIPRPPHVAIWENVVEGSPLKARGFLNLGTIHQDREEYDLALAAYAQAVDRAVMNPDGIVISQNLGASALANMASIYIMLGQWDDAERALADAQHYFPPHVHVWLNLVALYIDTNRIDAALAAANEGLVAWPDSGVMRFNRGQIYAKLGRCDEARAEWKAAQALDPTTRYPVAKCETAS